MKEFETVVQAKENNKSYIAIACEGAQKFAEEGLAVFEPLCKKESSFWERVKAIFA